MHINFNGQSIQNFYYKHNKHYLAKEEHVYSRTGSNLADICRFPSHTGNNIIRLQMMRGRVKEILKMQVLKTYFLQGSKGIKQWPINRGTS